MTDREISWQEIRAIISMCAFSSAIVLCHALKHFRIELSHPSTWLVVTEHRCGRILIASLTWFLCEMVYRLWSNLSLFQRYRPELN
jgi:hypothetical protein